ncbi:MAG TPA: hypothetical protein VF115_01815 [Acidimicrobiia bacterium]
MAVELDGNVRMRGDTGPGVRVHVLADGKRLRLVSGNELVGDWVISEIGIVVLQDGFNVKAEGEEFVLRTEDDVALAEEIGIAAASPRLARRLAARHNPEAPPEPEEPAPIRSNLGAIGFAVAGGLIILGGTFLNLGDGAARGGESGTEFWIAFVIGGVLMIAAAFVMSLGTRFATTAATVLLLATIIAFGFLVSGVTADASDLTAYGFIAGGLVVGVAVLFSGSLHQSE